MRPLSQVLLGHHDRVFHARIHQKPYGLIFPDGLEMSWIIQHPPGKNIVFQSGDGDPHHFRYLLCQTWPAVVDGDLYIIWILRVELAFEARVISPTHYVIAMARRDRPLRRDDLAANFNKSQ